MSEIPAPLTPADCDLQDFPFMPLMVGRLRKSKAWVKARRNPALGFYMINLWASAWHDVPAGSLEDDEDVLADAAMCDPSKWAKVRDEAMRGWIKCSDGRLYHPVVCERVIDAWAAKTDRQEKNDHERDRKRVEREERAKHFATLKAAGIHKPWNTNLSDLREAIRDLSAGQAPDKSGTVPDPSRLREGQGDGEGQGKNSSVPNGTGGDAAVVRTTGSASNDSNAGNLTRREELERLVDAAAETPKLVGGERPRSEQTVLWNGVLSWMAILTDERDPEKAAKQKVANRKYLGQRMAEHERSLVIEVFRDLCVERPGHCESWIPAAIQFREGTRDRKPKFPSAAERRVDHIAELTGETATKEPHADQPSPRKNDDAIDVTSRVVDGVGAGA